MLFAEGDAILTLLEVFPKLLAGKPEN